MYVRESHAINSWRQEGDLGVQGTRLRRDYVCAYIRTYILQRYCITFQLALHMTNIYVCTYVRTYIHTYTLCQLSTTKMEPVPLYLYIHTEHNEFEGANIIWSVRHKQDTVNCAESQHNTIQTYTHVCTYVRMYITHIVFFTADLSSGICKHALQNLRYSQPPNQAVSLLQL